jgi:FO synthase
MEVAHMCDISGRPAAEVFAALKDAGLGSTPGTAAEVLDDGVRERISPNKLPVARWVEIIAASHEAGLRSTATVMFGHIEEPWELAEHMRVVRELQERTAGITEFVEESISRLAGSYHGTRLDPDQLVAAAHEAGRPAAERTTLYEIRRRYELPVAA